MPQSETYVTRFVFQLVDLAVVSLALITTCAASVSSSVPAALQTFLSARITLRNALACATFLLFWHVLFRCARLYQVNGLSRRQEVVRTIAACFGGSVLALVFPAVSETGPFSITLVFTFWAVVTGALSGLRLAVFGLQSWTQQVQQVLIVGTGPLARKAAAELTQNAHRTNVIGYVDCRDRSFIPRDLAPAFLGRTQELDTILMHGIVDHVLIALPVKSCYDAIQGVIETCEKVGVPITLLSDVFEFTLARRTVLDGTHTTPFLHMAVAANDERVIVKRLFDVVAAGAAIVVLTPVMLGVALLVKLTSRGPVLFVQERYGLHKRRFRMLKFRTMVQDAEALQATLESRNEVSGPAFKMRDDPRITPVGRLLRQTSLDELPQLLNVLVGDMSLVGPRPLPVRDVARFSEAWLMRRFSVKPGLTCLWQISGRSNTSFDEWIRLDLKYIDTWSLSLDFLILARTVSVVFKGEGAV